MSFSDRIGVTQKKSILQIDTIDLELKNSLWNVYYTFFIQDADSRVVKVEDSEHSDYFHAIWRYYFKHPIDEMTSSYSSISKEIRSHFFNSHWYFVYNLIEFSIDLANELYPERRPFIIAGFNSVLKSEMSAYRIIDGQFVPIVSPQEIESIENAIAIATEKDLVGVKTHLENSLTKLSDKINPDYRNSIKESISAVESICKSVSGENGADLSKALQKIKESIGMHPAFSDALKKLYAYTSNEGGIRHSILDEKEISQEDAVFMLVTCSAFINYMIIKNGKAEKLTDAHSQNKS